MDGVYLGHIVAAGHHTAGFNAHAGHDARADIASRIGQSPFSADRDAALAGIRTVPYT